MRRQTPTKKLLAAFLAIRAPAGTDHHLPRRQICLLPAFGAEQAIRRRVGHAARAGGRRRDRGTYLLGPLQERAKSGPAHALGGPCTPAMCAVHRKRTLSTDSRCCWPGPAARWAQSDIGRLLSAVVARPSVGGRCTVRPLDQTWPLGSTARSLPTHAILSRASLPQR